MPQELSNVQPAARSPHAQDVGPVLECSPAATDASESPLRIRAFRVYPVSRDEIFNAWTRRSSWDYWMRLRSRSRVALAPYRGGDFRIELAEGPTIHVITGVIDEIRPPESVSFTWTHHNTPDHGSLIDVTFRQRPDGAELKLVHWAIGSRREAAWLMRLWSIALGRLGSYLVDTLPVLRERAIGVASRGIASATGAHHASSAA